MSWREGTRIFFRLTLSSFYLLISILTLQLEAQSAGLLFRRDPLMPPTLWAGLRGDVSLSVDGWCVGCMVCPGFNSPTTVLAKTVCGLAEIQESRGRLHTNHGFPSFLAKLAPTSPPQPHEGQRLDQVSFLRSGL